jgi:hypothetical protein
LVPEAVGSIASTKDFHDDVAIGARTPSYGALGCGICSVRRNLRIQERIEESLIGHFLCVPSVA